LKVPFLNKRIEAEYLDYLVEFRTAVENSTKTAEANPSHSRAVFAKIYPVCALLRCLESSTYTRDPARSAVLSELATVGDKAAFIRAINYFNRPKEFQTELINGVQRQIFSGYFNELFSDILLLLNSFYTNNYRGAMIAVRCMLEDLYRHLYYRDHPQEFWALTHGNRSEHELGIRPSVLRNYLKQTEYLCIFTKLNEKFLPKQDKESDLFDLNEKLYSDCSAYVHGSAKFSLNSFRTNIDLTTNLSRESETIKVISSFTKIATSFLLAAHLDQYQAISEYERSIILSMFSSSERAALRRVLNI